MTKKKDLKKRVRARQEKTGERYTTALARVRGPRIPEAPDATQEAQDVGLHCTAVVSPRLRALGDLRPLFVRLRELLEALDAEACGPLLRGEPAPRRMPTLHDMVEIRSFLARVREGERGLSPNGRIAAFGWHGLTVLCAMTLLGRRPLLQLAVLGDTAAWWPAQLALLGIGG